MDFDRGFVLGALWGIACGVWVVAPYVRDARERRRTDVRRAVHEALESERLVYGHGQAARDAERASVPPREG